MTPTADTVLQPIPVQAQSEQQMFARKISELPQLMKEFISKEMTTDLAINLTDTYRLNGPQNKAMIFLEGEIIVKHIRPADAYSFVRQHIISDEAQAKKFTVDFLGQLCLPMQWYIGNVEGLLKELGGDVQKYITEAQKNYPEVYALEARKDMSTPENTTVTKTTAHVSTDEHEPVILRDIEDKLGTAKGRAGVLLHLVRLSQQVEEAGKNGKMTKAETDDLLHGLDALSYAVNTQDLNPLEIAAIKRRLKNILAKVGE